MLGRGGQSAVGIPETTEVVGSGKLSVRAGPESFRDS